MKSWLWRSTFALVAAAGVSWAVALTIANHRLQTRLEKLEVTVAKRDDADPLIPWECNDEDVCYVEFKRLLRHPELFHNRIIHLRARYTSGFEHSTLFSPHFVEGDIDFGECISLESIRKGSAWPNDDLQGIVVTVEGKFINRPSGHMRQYFGALDDVKLLRRDET